MKFRIDHSGYPLLHFVAALSDIFYREFDVLVVHWAVARETRCQLFTAPFRISCGAMIQSEGFALRSLANLASIAVIGFFWHEGPRRAGKLVIVFVILV